MKSKQPESTEEIKPSSDWNSSQLVFLRIHEIKLGMRQAKLRKDYIIWRIELDNYYNEISYFMSDSEEDDYQMLVDAGRSYVSKPKGFRFRCEEYYNRADRLLNAVYNAKGLGVKLREDAILKF